ncbi:MAG: hypothetical protein LBH44_08660 [Treponema sp.]|nr:hypothetical protein [Treponema sp.]
MNTRKLLEKITANWPAKVLSVAAALILSVFHRMSMLETRLFSTPLRVETSELFIPAGSYTNVIRVSVRGDTNSIYLVLEDDIEPYIDLKKYTEDGTYQVPVQIHKKGSALLAGPLEITVEPLEITLKLERKLSRNMPVIPVFRGRVAEGYEITDSSLVPAAVIAEGPRSILNNIDDFRTDIINVEGRNEDFTIMVNILNDNPLIVIHGNEMVEYRGVIRRHRETGDEN